MNSVNFRFTTPGSCQLPGPQVLEGLRKAVEQAGPGARAWGPGRPGSVKDGDGSEALEALVGGDWNMTFIFPLVGWNHNLWIMYG